MEMMSCTSVYKLHTQILYYLEYIYSTVNI